LLAKNPADRFATAQEVESRFASLLAQMQQGHRLRRRGWWRHFRHHYLEPGRPLFKRLAIGVTAALACMLIGASVVYFVAPWTTWVGRTSETPSPTGFLGNDASVSTEPRLPPDTFARDLGEASKLLDTIESHAAIGSIATGAGQNAQWQSDVSDLRLEVLKLEDSFGTRPPTPATETPPPTPERNER
jgi:hypothetical protein